MLLAVDVGNTNTVLGAFEGRTLRQQWRVETSHSRTADEYGIQLRQLFAAAGVEPRAVDAVAVSSVVPPLAGTLTRMSERYFGVKPLFVGPGVKTGMPILYDNPREVGADRIVNAVAAWDRWACGMVVVDFGTATTFDAVSQKGEYLGGAISPGIGISMEALFTHAAKLPEVEFARPPHVIGKNTVASMQSGLVYGYVGLVDGICERMAAELGFTPKVVATGGLAPLLAGVSRSIDEVDEHLTLRGLCLIHERNR
ncbi:MAG TPA: type III pantothenate kinase [Anaeromyxobacteraceae bacterium]|nr:type III pantothenate kinase [Anaeromyxobacteraceae bacterium]